MPMLLLRSLFHDVLTNLSGRASRASEPTRELTMRYLIVVARNQPALYEHLRKRHGRDPRVRVVVDRRGAGEVETTANPPPVERRRRRSWLSTGASHELVEVQVEETAESRSPKQEPGVRHEEASGPMSETQMSGKETLEDPQRVTRWLAESQEMLARAIPALIGERDRLRQSLEARERECEQLRGELAEVRRNFGALQGELEGLRGERAAVVETFADIVDLVGQLHRPIDEIARRLRAVQPVPVETRSPSAGEAAVRPTRRAGVDAAARKGGA
jgi:hypothetical protein